MIDEIIWPFAIKAVAERLNSLRIDLKVRTSEFILHGVEVEIILLKYYHTHFSQSTRSALAFRVLETQAHQNGIHVRVLEYTLGISCSTLAVWHLCGIQPQA